MPNERLRAAILRKGLNPTTLAGELGVDTKTVERWIGGRTPYRKHRYAVASLLGMDEVYLWPDALPKEQVASASESEVVSIYPHRTDVPREVWLQFFSSAERDLGILVYAGLFLAEDAAIQRLLVQKAGAGVRVRVLLGDPESAYAAQRSLEEGVEGAFAWKIRSAISHFRRSLDGVGGAELRMHRTILYNSIYVSDDQILVNAHVYGVPAPQAPILHLKKVAGGELASSYLDSFEQVWLAGEPFGED